jgi:uncharacterized protein YdeI (YjbR/CyaY-like superfamily)
VVTCRKAAAAGALPAPSAIEEALCFGWTEHRTRSLDDTRRLAWMAPRKPASGWSRAHKEMVGRLTQEARMAPAGTACVRAAKRSGAWTLLDDVDALVVPPDLARALDAHGSSSNFARLAPSMRRIALERIHAAKKPQTRAARVEETARLAKMDIVLTQWRINSRR